MTLEELQESRDIAYTAYKRALIGKGYSVNSGNASRNLQRQDLKALKGELDDLEEKIGALDGTGRTQWIGVPPP